MAYSRTKKLTNASYSPDSTTTPRQDVDGAIQEAFDYADATFALKTDVQGLVLGQIPNGTITDAKLSDTAGQIKDVFNSHLLDYVRQTGYGVTTGTSTAYVLTLTPTPTAYVDGMQITIVPHVDCGATPTLNINALGASTILKQDGSSIAAGEIKANKPLSLVRVGSNFFIRSAGGSGIKSIQRGSVTIAGGSTSNTATISAVDTTKSVLILINDADYTANPNSACERGVVTNSTTLTFTRVNSTAANTVYYQVIEYSGVKSLQKGQTSITSGTPTPYIAISAVDLSKAVVYSSYSSSSANAYPGETRAGAYLTSNTQLNFIRGDDGTYIYEWQVVEFA